MRGNLLGVLLFIIALGLWSIIIYEWVIEMRPHPQIQILPVTT